MQRAFSSPYLQPVLTALLLAALLQQPAPAYRVGPSATPAYRIAPGAEEAEEAVGAPAIPLPELARTGVTIEAYDPRVESRWGTDDPYYSGTIRGGAAIAQSRQGPLDGGWTVLSPDGRQLYALQLVDTGDGGVEGAWREVLAAAPGAGHPEASGFIPLISREAGRTVLRFLQPGAAGPTVVTLQPSPDGTWRGELARGAGPASPVVMRRR